MSKKVLLTATVQSHICQFHKPLMKLLKDYGYEVYVAAKDNLAEKNGLAMEYTDKVFDVPFYRNPFDIRNIKAYLRLKKIINEYSFEVIHTNTPVGGIVTRLAALKVRETGTKVFYTAHGFHFYNGAPLKNWLIYYPVEKFFSVFTDKLITITSEDFNLAKKKFKCEVCYIHGVGANSSRFKAVSETKKSEARKKYGLDKETLIVINVGELLPNKNQKTAILAMKDIVKEFSNALLLIAGNGPEKHNLEKLISENDLCDNVKLLGYTMELPEYLAAADLLIACSYREGLPMNVLEAMMSGKPVVASDNRGHRELVKSGHNGFIVDANDVSAFYKAIIGAYKKRDEFSINSLNYSENYKDYNVANELKLIYELR